ncbi:MAG: hypothetical protein Q8R35_01070 [bacterium]|nr:hypothetical protein [bacterium]
MKLAAAILAAAGILFLIPSAAGAGGDAQNISFHSPAGASPRFEQFFREYEGMVRSWWAHGGSRATRGRWHVTAAEVVRPGAPEPHFVLIVAVEQEGFSLLLRLTFEVPPEGQANLFHASHAAYSATLGALLGEYQGRRVWRGLPPGETVFHRSAPLPIRAAAFLFVRLRRDVGATNK